MIEAENPAQSTDWIRYRATPLAGVTLMHAHFTDHAFERHSHAEYGIGLTYSGVQTFHCGGTVRRSTPGNVIFLNPDQAHDGLPGEKDGYRYSMLYVDTDVMAALSERAAGTLHEHYFRDAVVHAPASAALLHQAIEAAGQVAETLRGETLLLQTSIHLLLRYGDMPRMAQTPVGAGLNRLTRVRDYIESHADQNITIGELAREAGVSRVYLSRAFTHHFGVPPHVYLNAVRLAHARRLLMRGMPLAAVATTAAFADQSHFNRRFKGAVGLAPGVWLGQMRAR